MNRTPTAVEWLVNVVQACIAPEYIPSKIIEQAMEMEKDQIETAFSTGYTIGGWEGPMLSSEYYNETFKNK